jgi:Spy/CpxP family protein refolding chaperone
MNSKIKLFPLLAGAIALSVSLAPILPALAQSPESSTPTEQNRMPRHRNWLNLTPDQQAQMEQIRQNTRSQIDAILTAEQRAQLQRERENRGTPQAGEHRGMRHLPFDSLNLTDEQRSQIETVMRSSREQMDAILTPEQRQQLQQHRQDYQQRHQADPQANPSR